MSRKAIARTNPRAEFVKAINQAWASGPEHIFEVGDLLIEAKKQLPHGQFEAMVESDLPFSSSTARKLREIAQDPKLRNRAHAHALPSSWTTLSELQKLKPKAFKKAVNDNQIKPEMQRSDAKRLRRDSTKDDPIPGVAAPSGYAPPKTVCYSTSTTVWIIKELEELSDWSFIPKNKVLGTRRGAKGNGGGLYSGQCSVFSPHLAEWILLRWAGDKCRRVLDPFAGYAVRGVVAAHMKYDYHGIDVWADLLRENRSICKGLGLKARYYLGDATTLKCVKGEFDFAFTCPPYWDLEHFSESDGCLAECSDYADFDNQMAKFAQALRPRMRPGANVCITIGDVRDKATGKMIDVPGHTIRNFENAGFRFHERVVVINPDGTAPQRVGNAWKGKKLVSLHEFVLVFKTPED